MDKKADGDANRVVLFTSEKGGAGKSFGACSLIDYARSSGQRVAAYDSDGGVGALLKLYGSRGVDGDIEMQQDPVAGVGYYNLRNDDERSTLVNACASGECVIVHDLAGGGLADLMRIQDAGAGLKRLLRAFDSTGYRVTFVHLLTNDDSATASVATYLDMIEEAGEVGKIVDHVVVKNRLYGARDIDFPFWVGFKDHESGETIGGGTRARIKAAGGVEIELPSLDRRTAAMIKPLGIKLADGETSRRLDLSSQQHVRNYRIDFAEAIAPAKSLMGLA